MTTTSYAVLGLLCVQPFSAYELTQQMRRSLRFLWPRAESGIYREPQKLVDLGYAAATEVPAGPRRTKAQYAATPAGRAALREWLAAPSAPPQFESEALVKFFFADHGELADARATLNGLAADADALWDTVAAIIESHQDPLGPVPRTSAHRHPAGPVRVRLRGHPRRLGGLGPGARRAVARHRAPGRRAGGRGPTRGPRAGPARPASIGADARRTMTRRGGAGRRPAWCGLVSERCAR